MDLTGFLFGNVNKQGELENEEVLDRVRWCVMNDSFIYMYM